MTKNKKKQRQLTIGELAAIIRIFLDKHEADMAADYRPNEPLWRKLLAESLADFILSKL